MRTMHREKKPLMALFILAAFFGFTALVMLLWNATLPAVLGVKTISYLQAMGILVLSKILFGGFHGKGGGRNGGWKSNMRERIASMTPEERERFRSEWKDRCRTRWGARGNAPQPENPAS